MTPMKVLIKAPLSPYTGYGNDGIGMARAFMRWGADVYLQPTIVQAPLPEDVAVLLAKELRAPFDLAINHVDPAALDSTQGIASASAVCIGWTMWEYSNLGNLPGRSKLRKKLREFDAVVGYDDVTVDGFRSHFSGPLIIQQGGFWPKDWPLMERDYFEENFYFCMLGVLSERKDPFVAIEAFIMAQREHPEFAKHARLSLKTNVPGLHSSMADVHEGLRIYYDNWPYETVLKFYESQHVLVAPSRGEGKNMPALEFMSTGGTVIATDWAGHTQWLDSSYAYPLDYELKPVSPEYPNTLNARASVQHLKELMIHTFENRAEVKRKADLAGQIIPRACSWDTVIENLMRKLSYALPQGPALWEQAVACRVERSDDE